MRKIILFMHVSLDGFVAGPNGEMDWIHVDEDVFEYAGNMTDQSDTALYGRITYSMMEGYWPTAADKPNASKHDIQHSRWYSSVSKVVMSNTLKDSGRPNVTIIGGNVKEPVQELKRRQGKNIIIFGSPGASHSLMQYNLIDEYWLFVNPVILGKGIPLFKNVTDRVKLKLADSNIFPSGVAGLHYVQ